MKSLLLLLFAAATVCAAGESNSQPQTITHRITGLFAPSREADLRAVVEQIPDVRLVSIDFDHAEATFTYDPAIAFKGTKPEEVQKRFDEKLRAVSQSTFGVQPLITTPKDRLKRVEIPVVGLDCKACCLAAYEVIAKIGGVAQATASFKDGLVTALIDPAKTGREALQEALKKRNVTVTVL